TNAQSDPLVFTINKADPHITVTPYSVNYDGNAHTAAGSATGVLGETLSGLDLSGTTHINAGNYSDTWTFTDLTGNYQNDGGTVSDTIAKIEPTFRGADLEGGTYNGQPFPFIVTATGVTGAPVSGNFSFTYYFPASPTAPTNAGDYLVK